MTPFKSDDLTTIIESKKNLFVVQWSPRQRSMSPAIAL
jgi:hypothetical protein